ncbi:MAG: molybdenum ABC transporter ATP-binding protein [Gammaproteobacteria bacterium]|nr:molybdenum ABC transporter ATP-binding protein [Gammaproteobacteria bacterium]
MSTDTLQIRYVLERPQFDLDVAIDIPMRGITGIFGESGAGKTTLLRCIAGLELPTSGTLLVGGETWQDQSAGFSRPVHEREIGYVFQEPRLFSHLDVQSNLVYGNRRAGANGGAIEFDRVTDLLGLERMLNRKPAELSGGEAQRVAIGRALLRAPRLVLMDEPLASLDTKRRNEILPFLDRLHAELSIPIVYVSHNIEEVCRLCDHLVVIDAGRVVAEGELQAVLVRMDVPQLSGEEAGSVILGTVSAYDPGYDLTTIKFSGGEFRVPGDHGEADAPLRLRIRANDISLCREKPGQTTILNVLAARIDAMQELQGASRLLRLRVGDELLLARITRRSCDELGLRSGDKIQAQIKAVAVRSP